MSGVCDVLSNSGQDRYMQEIRRFPLLSPEEELRFARRWRDHRDVQAANAIISSHLRLVAKIAAGYVRHGLRANDLIGAGHLGIVRAMGRFNPDLGCRFATYATWWIKAAIADHILQNRYQVKIATSAGQKKLFFSLRRIRNEIKAMGDGDLTSAQAALIAGRLGVSQQDVIDMDRRLLAVDCSLNAPIPNQSDGGIEWQDMLADETEGQEAVLAERDDLADRRTRLSRALTTLNERERHILCERRLKERPTSLQELARRQGVSFQRVPQIEMRAFAKLQSAMVACAGT